jgi:hypothetical protein
MLEHFFTDNIFVSALRFSQQEFLLIDNDNDDT